MMDAIRESVLRRKLVPRPEEPAFEMPFAFDDAPAPEEPAGRVLPRSFTRAANRVLGLVAQGAVCSSRTAAVPELLELIDPEGFVALLARGDEPPGLVIFDPHAFVAVIEAMTIGTLGRRAPPPRRATATDAALIAELVDAVLGDVDANPDPVDPFASGFRFGQHARDQRLLDVMLDDVSYALTVMDVEFNADDVVRKGRFILALPEAPQPMIETFSFDEPAFDEPAQDSAWEEALQGAVMAAPADLRAVLGRVRMPLSQVLELGTDSRLVLPLAQLEEVQLEALDRRPVGLGRLGQYRGMRALRLTVLPGERDLSAGFTSNGGSGIGNGADFSEAGPPSLGDFAMTSGEGAAFDDAGGPAFDIDAAGGLPDIGLS